MPGSPWRPVRYQIWLRPPHQKKIYIYGKNENKNETTSKIKPSQQWWSTSSALMPFNNQPTFWQTSDRIWAKYGSHWWISCGSSLDTHSSGFNIETSNSHTFCKGHWSIFPPLTKIHGPSDVTLPFKWEFGNELISVWLTLCPNNIYIFVQGFNKLAKKEEASSD